MRKKALAVSFFILLFGLTSSIYIFFQIRQHHSLVFEERFSQQTQAFLYAMNQRILRNQVLIKGYQGLLEASDYVSQEEWTRFNQALDLHDDFPSIMWIGLAKKFATPLDQENFQKKENPNFHIWPENDQAISFIYIYPKEYTTLIGYNLLKNQDTAPLLQGPIKEKEIFSSSFSSPFLSQTQGAVLFLSNFKKNGSDFFIGLTMNFLSVIESITKKLNLQSLNIQIYEGDAVDTSHLIFERILQIDPYPLLSKEKKILVGSKTWTILFTSTPDYRKQISDTHAYFISFGVFLLGCLLAYLSYRMAHIHRHSLLSCYAPILDSLLYGVLMTDKQGIIQFFNKSAERMLGYSSFEVVGKITPEVFHDQREIDLRKQEMSQLFGKEITTNAEVFTLQAAKGIPEEREWTYVRKDKTRFPILLSVTVVRDEMGQIIGYTGLFKDLSAKK